MMISSTAERKPSTRQTFAKTGYTVQSVPSVFSRPNFGRFFVSCIGSFRTLCGHCRFHSLNGAVPFACDLGGIPHALACFQ